MKSCVECEWQGPELPGPAVAREIHRGLHGLGRRFLEVLDPIVAGFVPIKPLADLDAPDFDLDRNSFAFRAEPRLFASFDLVPRPSMFERNKAAIEEELGKDWSLRPAVPEGFKFVELCLCDYRHIRGGLSQEIIRTEWRRHPGCRFDHAGGSIK